MLLSARDHDMLDPIVIHGDVGDVIRTPRPIEWIE